jgi:hypothetical protein
MTSIKKYLLIPVLVLVVVITGATSAVTTTVSGLNTNTSNFTPGPGSIAILDEKGGITESTVDPQTGKVDLEKSRQMLECVNNLTRSSK